MLVAACACTLHQTVLCSVLIIMRARKKTCIADTAEMQKQQEGKITFPKYLEVIIYKYQMEYINVKKTPGCNILEKGKRRG